MIPTVKEQVRQMIAGRTAKDADGPQRATLDARKLTILGSVGSSTFAVGPDGRELRLKGPAQPHQLDRAPSDAIIITKLVRAADGRPRTDIFVGRMVESGTFERLARRKRYVPKERPAGPIDGLAELRKPADRLPVRLGTDDDSPLGIVRGAMSKRPTFLMTDSSAVPMTVRRLIEVANAAGANLRHYRGHTLADWTHIRRWRALLVAAWPLVDAHLAGTPLGCSYEHEGTPPPADTLDPAGVPLCNQHVGEGPRAA
jgi:hypothetical protein